MKNLQKINNERKYVNYKNDNKTYQLLTCNIVRPVFWANSFFWSSDGYGCYNEKNNERNLH